MIMACERVEWVPNHGSGVEESRLLAIMVGVGLLVRLARRGTCCLVQKMSEGAGLGLRRNDDRGLVPMGNLLLCKLTYNLNE